MVESDNKRKIKYALKLDGWSYEHGSKENLKLNAIKVTPSEYLSEMDGSLFCPVCYTNLIRVPKIKDHFSNGREAYFCHLPAYKEIKCDLRSSKPEGKRYETYEEARKAIDDENLVIVEGFMKEKPKIPDEKGTEYDETPVEDVNGPLADVPIGRHTGESFKLPSKVTTVAGICRNFEDNLYKYYYFPNQKHPVMLVDLLHPVDKVTEEDTEPKLYYGRIVSTVHLGANKKPNNIRMTYLKNDQISVKDFCIKLKHEYQKNHGICDSSVGRTVIIYGKVSSNGIGLCFKDLAWGEFALLPTKYDLLLK